MQSPEHRSIEAKLRAVEEDEMKRKVIHLMDITQAEVDDTCGMRYWLSYMEGGRGMTPTLDVIPNMIEQETHNDFRTISSMPDLSADNIKKSVDDILSKLTEDDKKNQRRMELMYRRLGWLAAFALYIEPKIREQYYTILTDGEQVLNRDPLMIVTYPDRVLRSKANSEVTYREYVPMIPGVNHHNWLDSFKYRVRLHAGIAAMEEARKEHIAYGQVMGLSKGYYSLFDKRLVHPYVWGYYHAKKEEWTHSQTVVSENAAGWKQMPVWNFLGGVVAWVKMCGESVANVQFPLSGMVKQDKLFLQSWVDRRLHREREIRGVNGECYGNKKLRAIYFARRTDQCQTTVGEDCPYVKACWDKKIGAEPFKSGAFVPKRSDWPVRLTEVLG